MVYKHITFIVQSVTQENDIYNGKNSVKKTASSFYLSREYSNFSQIPKGL